MANIPQNIGTELAAKYVVENNTFKRKVKDGGKHPKLGFELDRIDVEIGDSKQPDFKPQFKFMRWSNEVNFSLRAEEKPEGKVKTKGEKMIYETNDYEVHMYDKPEMSEDGGFEFEWILPKKPKSNILTATIQTKGLRFLYQPELTEEEKGRLSPEQIFPEEFKDVILSKNPLSVLDIGGGRGELVRDLNELGIYAVNFEVSQDSFENKVTENFVQGDILNGLPFSDGEFDIVCGVGFLKYIPEDKIPFVLSEISRVGSRRIFAVGISGYQPGDAPSIVNLQSKNYWENVSDFEYYDLCQHISHRPENVVGSYAVYHATKDGLSKSNGYEYKAGKVFHIYRPKVTDADDNETWGELNIDEQTNKLSVTVDQNFLDNAVYPVIVDPTFGYTSVGASTELTTASGDIQCSFSPSEDGDISSISVYTKDRTNVANMKALVYSSTSNTPDALLLTTSSGTLPASLSWLQMSGSLSISSGTQYFLGAVTDANAYGQMETYYDTDAAVYSYETAGNNYTTPDDPHDSVGADTDKKYSIYATYTPDSGVEHDFLQYTEDTSNASTYTFSSENLGAADADRYIVVNIMSRSDPTSGLTIDSVTIGGQSATIAVQVEGDGGSGDNCIAGIAIAQVTTGTTGDVVVTFSDTMFRCAIAVYRLIDVTSTTASDTASDGTTDDPSLTLDVPANGWVTGCGITGDNTSTAALTGVDTNFYSVIENAARTVGGARGYDSAQTNHTVAIDYSVNADQVAVAASWQFNTGGGGGVVHFPFMTTNSGFWGS